MLQGWVETLVDVVSGTEPQPSSTFGFTLTYVGGKTLGSSQFGGGGSNPVAVKGVTIPPGELGLPNPISWLPDFFVTFSGCSATYEGVKYKGFTGGNQNGDISTSACTVQFACESNLT